MRNQWRLFLRHNLLSTPTRISRPFFYHKVISSSSFSTVSLFTHYNPASKNPTFPCHFNRFYSSELPIYEKSPDTSLMIDIFKKEIDGDDIKKELVSNNVVLTRDLINEVLKNLINEPNTAIKLFDWVLERESDCVSSNAYNLMLGLLGSNGFVKEFWGMLDEMRKKGFGVKRGAFDAVLERFEKDGLEGDVKKLKGLFVKQTYLSAESVSSRVVKIVRREVWDESVEKDLKELGVGYSSELVKLVLEKLGANPMKGLMFFRWMEESGLFKHDQVTYNTMAVVLGREDCVVRFWNVVREMRDARCEMEMKTYVKVLGRFVQRRLMADAVSLFEFAMKGANKPSRLDCTFLLRKLATAQELDMELFSRVVKAFTEKGFALEDSMLDAVLKALTSVGRMSECNKVLDAMVEVGFAPSGSMQGRVAFDLSSSKMKDEANEFMEKLKDHGLTPDYKTWASLIEGHCVAGDLDKATDCFKEMVDQEGVTFAGYPLDLLVNAYCSRDRAADACKILSDLVSKENVNPWHNTYKTLIVKLIEQKGFQDALPMLGLMKNHGFPPFLDPFINYITRKGTPDEGLLFFKAMTVKRFPSTNVVLRVFEAFFKAGRYKQAQNLLANCPKYIRNNADVLNLFCSMKIEKPPKTETAAETAAVAA